MNVIYDLNLQMENTGLHFVQIAIRLGLEAYKQRTSDIGT